MSDDLNAPLGRRPKRGRTKHSLAGHAAIAGALGFCLLAFIAWTIFVNDPLGGEPTAIVAINDQGGPPPAKPADAAAAGQNPSVKAEPKEGAAAEAPAKPSGQTVTIIDGSSGNRQEVEIPGSAAAAKTPAGDTKPDAKLLETTRHGTIPKIGVDGTRPVLAYAKPVPPPNAAKANLPRITLVVGGLGISSNNTAEAFAKLPGPVAFALSPYATDLERLATRARSEGHELLLQVPMEPLDYPESDPGPQTLLTTLATEQNIDRMYWLMSRFQGYVGIANFMGARFTATEASFAPILRETAKRGLMFFDDASSPRSLAGQIAGANNLPFVKATIVLDSVATPAEIDRALGRLESAARDTGMAVGYATVQPVSIDRLSRWAKGAEGRGFLLVPITAAANKSKSS